MRAEQVRVNGGVVGEATQTGETRQTDTEHKGYAHRDTHTHPNRRACFLGLHHEKDKDRKITLLIPEGKIADHLEEPERLKCVVARTRSLVQWTVYLIMSACVRLSEFKKKKWIDEDQSTFSSSSSARLPAAPPGLHRA